MKRGIKHAALNLRSFWIELLRIEPRRNTPNASNMVRGSPHGWFGHHNHCVLIPFIRFSLDVWSRAEQHELLDAEGTRAPIALLLFRCLVNRRHGRCTGARPWPDLNTPCCRRDVKQPWHPTNFRNQEKLWKAEQKEQERVNRDLEKEQELRKALDTASQQQLLRAAGGDARAIRDMESHPLNFMYIKRTQRLWRVSVCLRLEWVLPCVTRLLPSTDALNTALH
jgi:hypothetical protein